MTGLIWVIQLLHYPAFLDVDKAQFVRFHARHSQKITFIVGPVMLIELVTALMLLSLHSIMWVNLLLLVLIWLSTAFLSVPIHNSLSQGSDSKKIAKLVMTNWPRTLLWSIRLVLLATYFIKTFGGLNVNFI